MAFSTLDGLRTGRLNGALGLSADGDNAFGTTTERNDALKVAIARLWPVMARLLDEEIALSSTTLEYTLTTLRTVEKIDVKHSSAGVVGRVPEWDLLVDEAADPVVVTVRFKAVPASTTTHTYVATGYVPYASEVAGAGSLDIPPRLEWIVVRGALAELYRRKLNQRVNFEQHANENRDTDVTVQELIAIYQLAQREFEAAMEMNKRSMSGGRR